MIKVYSQLTLSPIQIQKILPDAIVSPPIKQNDIYSDLNDGIKTIIIIDGRFHQDLAVTCGELMDALRSGVLLIGSSSMGALRAAEMSPYGMLGHGEIYEHICQTPDFRDDYLGQVFHEDNKVKNLSIPYVDFYFNIKKLLLRREISQEVFKNLSQIYSDIYYPERNWLSFKARIQKTFPNRSNILNLAHKAMLKMGSQKEKDALETLKMVKSKLKNINLLNAKLHKSRKF